MATQYFGVAVSNYRVDELARDVERVIGARRGRPTSDGELGRACDRVRRSRARRSSARCALARTAAAAPRAPCAPAGDDRVRVDAGELEPRRTSRARALVDALDALRGRRRARAGRPPRTCRRIGRRAGEMRDDLRFLLRADDRDYVYYLELRGRGVFLRAAPIDVSAHRAQTCCSTGSRRPC